MQVGFLEAVTLPGAPGCSGSGLWRIVHARPPLEVGQSGGQWLWQATCLLAWAAPWGLGLGLLLWLLLAVEGGVFCLGSML